MANQVILAWTVSVANTPLGPVQAAARLSAVPLFLPAPSPGVPTTDPVLGQSFGLTVASDVTTNDATSATRTLTLNMTPPDAPAPFPCHPLTSTPPTLPYPLRRAATLPGSFFPQSGLMNVPTTVSQIPSLSVNDNVQFLSQEGVFYEVASVGPTSINLASPYTGTTKNTGAAKEVAAPVTIAAFYSSSELDTDGVATVPTAIPAGAGARTVQLTYKDSTGGSFVVTTSLTGKRPAAITLDPMSVDIAEIDNIAIASVGGFGNSVGEITLVALASALPPIPSNATAIDYARLTDEGQMLISEHLAYLPQSYFSLAQQGRSMPQLSGDFLLTTGSTSVPTTEDQTGVLSPGSVIQFAEQMTLDTAFGTTPVFYTVDQVTPKYITLTTPFTGIDDNNTGTNQEGTNSNAGTKGNLGSEILKKPSGAFCAALAQPPSSAQLSVPIGQFMETEVAAPPPKPPLSPATVPNPTFLSGLYTRTLALAMAGVPITSATVTFA